MSVPTSGSSGLSSTSVKGDGMEFRKPHEMIVMVPRSARVTLTARRIYTVLLHVSQTRMLAMGVMPLADFLFEAPLISILRTTGSDGADRTAAKRYLSEMRSLEVDWESTAPGDGVKWRGFSMLSEVALEVRRGETWVSWSFPPSIMSALRDPQRWARIDLELLTRLSTYAAIALYEICVRYRDNPGGVTSRKSVGWWTDALSNMPGGDRREWRKFKNERVKEAVAEINRETDLEIELIEHRQARVVIEVQFAVRKRSRHPVARLEEQPVDAALRLRGRTLGIREFKIESLIVEFGEERVREKLDKLERRTANDKLREIDDAYSYLRSLLRDDASEHSERTDDPVETLRVQSVPPALVAEKAPVSEEAGAGELIRAMRREVEQLEPAQLQEWVDRALHELATKGMLTAVISRRATQGDVLHGLLGSVVVHTYAAAIYGPAWNMPS